MVNYACGFNQSEMGNILNEYNLFVFFVLWAIVRVRFILGLQPCDKATTLVECWWSIEYNFFLLEFKVTRPSFLGGYHPTLKLSGIPTFTFIVSLTHRMDNI